MTDHDHLTASASDWLSALDAVLPAISLRPPLPILACAILEYVDDGAITITAYDYEVSARVTLPMGDGTPTRRLIPVRRVLDAIRVLCGRRKGDPVTIEFYAGKGWKEHKYGGRWDVEPHMVVAARGFRVPIVGRHDIVNEYPAVPRIASAPIGRVPVAELVRAVGRTVPANDDTFPILNAARVRFAEGRVAIASTDRYRLSFERIDAHGMAPDYDESFLVPVASLAAALRRIPSMFVEFGVTDTAPSDAPAPKNHGWRRPLAEAPVPDVRRLTIAAGTVEYTIIETSGDYPKVESLIPEVAEWTAILDREAVDHSASVAHLLAETNTPAALTLNSPSSTVYFTSEGITSSSPAIATDLVFRDRAEAGPVDTALNPKYLRAGLHALRASTRIRISGTLPNKPVILTDADVAHDNPDAYRLLVMPVRHLGR